MSWEDKSWKEAARDYHAQRGGSRTVIEIEPERLRGLRRLLDDNVSLERAYAELNSSTDAAAATLQAAENLVQLGDVERFRSWLDCHSAEERNAIRKHLEAKRCRSREAR
jgi:hypothetical protein